jgi:hypothetical protein
MKKDEILSKSRKEMNDEYEAKILKDAQIFGVIVIAAICIFFFIVNVILSDINGLKEGIARFDYAAILFAYLTGINFWGFAKSKSRNSLIAGFGFGFAFICVLVLYFISL